jgi:hypothetical protein
MANLFLVGYLGALLWSLLAGHYVLFGVLLAILALAIWQTADEL